MRRREDTHERTVLAFLERWIQDREHGRLASLEDYLAAFPGIAAQIREEYAALLDEPADTPAERLAHYRLLRVLGEGGQGVVYEAFDERLRRVVALKVLPRALVGGDGALPASLRRELEALSQLDHPGICVVHDAGTADGHAYLAMRLIRGRSLRELVGRLKPEQAIALVETLARALQAAHEAGVVHRDVKPANVMVDPQGEPVLLDFGLARAEQSELPSLTRTGDVLGTPHYLAPECLDGTRRADARSDVWSLGVLLHELLSGERPFAGHSLEAVARAVEREEPPDLSRRRGVSRDLAVVTRTALRKEPRHRYQSAAAFADDLARVRRGEPILARPVSLAGRTRRWMRRNPAPSAIVALLAVGATVAAWAAEDYRDLAERNQRSLARSEAFVARSALAQAQLLATTRTPGRTALVLEQVRQASEARARAIDLGFEAMAELPALPDLRRAWLDARLAPDATLQHEVDHEGYALGGLAPQARFVAVRRITPTQAGLRTDELVVRSVETGEVVARSARPEFRDLQEGIAVDPNGRWIAVPGPDERSLDLWDLATDQLVRRLPLPAELCLGGEERQPERHLRLWKLAFSPDGRRLAMSVAPREAAHTLPSPRGFAVWEVETGAQLIGARAGTVRYPWIGFSASGERVAVNPEPSVVEVYSLGADPASIARLDFGSPVRAALVTDDAVPRILVAIRASDAPQDLLALVNGKTGELVWRDSLPAAFEWAHGAGLVPSPDGVSFVHADEAGGLTVRELSSGRVLLRLEEAHEGRVESLAWSADGRSFASHARAARTRSWLPNGRPSFVDEEPVPHLGVDGGMLTVSADGEQIAFVARAQAQSIHLWDRARSGQPQTLQAARRATQAYQLHHDPVGGRLIEVGTDLTVVWDLATGTTESVAPEPGGTWIHGQFDADGRFWIVERTGFRYSLQCLETGRRVALEGLPDAGWIERSPDGKELILLPPDDVAEPIQVRALTLNATGEAEFGPALTLGETTPRHRRSSRISADGRWIGVVERAAGHELLIYDRNRGSLRLRIPLGTDPPWSGFAFDPLRPRVVVALEDGRLGLYDLEQGREWASWQAHTRKVQFVDFLPDGRVWSWGDRDPVRFWEMGTMTRLAPSGVGSRPDAASL